MSQTHNRKKQFDPNELDPCIAAEVRFKKQYLTMNEAKCVFCFLVFVLSVLLLAAGIIMIVQGSDPGSESSRMDLSSQLIDLSNNYNEKKEKQEEDYKEEKTFEEPKAATNTKKTASPPLLLGGPIHTYPIHQSKIQIRPHILKETSSINTYLPSTAHTPLLSNNLEGNSFGRDSTKKTSTATNSTIYSTGGDKLMDAVPLFESNRIGVNQKVYDHINTSTIEQHCEQYRFKGHSTSGVYKLQLPQMSYSFKALCLMESDYAWTVLQRRIGPDPPFWNASFNEYANGFGSPSSSYWLGLDKIHAFIAQNYDLQMRIELRGDFCDKGRKCSGEGQFGFWWGDWDFSISGKSFNFRLFNLKYLRGNLSDPDKPSADIFTQMSNNQPFTTVDKDNDSHGQRNGASFRHKGAWWHKDSTLVSLNGNYGSRSNVAEGQSYFWANSIGSAYNIKPITSQIMFRIKA